MSFSSTSDGDRSESNASVCVGLLFSSKYRNTCDVSFALPININTVKLEPKSDSQQNPRVKPKNSN